jgi:hypothetical protein
MWRQAFELDKNRFTIFNVVIYLLLQASSVGLGIIFYYLIGALKIKLILTTTILVPIIAVTFTAFYGIWQDNDYNMYEKVPGDTDLVLSEFCTTAFWRQVF